MYKGGTVCKDRFSDHSADAICRLLGYTRAINWENGYLGYNVQAGLNIALDDVECTEADWGSCWFSTSHNCYHDKDVHMSCYAAGFIHYTLYIILQVWKFKLLTFYM